MKKFIVSVSLILVSNLMFGQMSITSAKAKAHIGEIVSICDRIVDGKFLEGSITKPTLLNLGGAYPNHLFTIVINFENRKNFSFKPEEYYLNKRVCVTGKLVDFKGKPQIVVLSPAEMIITEDEVGLSPRSAPGVTNRLVATTTPVSSPGLNKPQPKETTPPATSNVINKISTPPPAKVNAVVQTAAASKPLGDTDTSKTVKSTDTYDIKLTDDINVRSGPGPVFEVLEIVKAGTVVTILSSENGWSYLSYDRYSQEQRRSLSMKGYAKNSVLK